MTSERTPITFRAWMTDSQRRTAKVIVAIRNIKAREFWEEAMVAHLEAREEADKEGVAFDYELIPRNAEAGSLYADEGLISEVDEWAIRDNVKKENGLYTAFSRHIARWAEQAITGFKPEY